jgi:phenylacetic acid degradation operon negative regulatory protein
VRARSALFTLFGDVVRPAGGEAWLSVLTACMGALDFTPEATRTALHRMAAEGWVEPRRAGRYAAYRLTAAGVTRLEEAAARIYRLRAADWDGRWRLLVCPSAGRDADVVRELRWIGFGRLSPDTWISPHPHGRRVPDLLAARGIDGDATRVVAERTDHDDAIVRRAWDLAELRAAHAAFLDRWRHAEPPAEPRAAFTTRERLVHHWRSFLFLDPGLPAALLPEDWLGEEAAGCFRALYEAVDAGAWRFYEALTTTAPTADVEPPPRTPAASPFARGLDALSTTGRPR